MNTHPSKRILMPLVALLCAMLACNTPTGQTEPIEEASPTAFIAPTFTPAEPASDEAAEAEEEPAAEAVQTDENQAPADPVQPTAALPAQPTPSARGGFIGLNSFALSELPPLEGLGGGAGGGGVACPVDAPPEGSDPTITYAWTGPGTFTLCIYGLAAQVGAPEFSVILTAPDGTVYSETYNIVNGAEVGHESIENALQGSRTPFDVYVGRGDPGTDGRMDSIEVFIFMTADVFMKGNWTIRAERTDGQGWFEVIEFLDSPGRWLTILPQGQTTDPFLTEFRSGFGPYSDGQVVSIYGTGHPENSDLVIALYGGERTPAPDSPFEIAQPQYAAVIRTDERGNFRADFQVGPETPADNYDVVINPQILDTYSLSDPGFGVQ